MKKRVYFTLWLAGILMGLVLLWLRPYTGYMDADYYYAGAKTLYEGKGFQDYYLWNYLNDPGPIPVPSHTYWMPMASLLAWLGMRICGSSTLLAARIPFVLLFSLVPPGMAYLSWKYYRNLSWAITSGLLALSCGYFLKFVTEPDGFAPLFLGGILLLLLLRDGQTPRWLRAGLLGILAGCVHLTRADGLGWLALLALNLWHEERQRSGHVFSAALWKRTGCLLAGYVLVMFPWYWRNLTALGSLMPSAGFKTIFLTDYNQMFSFPAKNLTFSAWVQSGLASILQIRWGAFLSNLLTVAVVFGMIVLLPSGWFGLKRNWRDQPIRFLIFAFLIFFAVMTLVFPLVGKRGGLLHSGAIFVPAFWLIIPAGNAALAEKIQRIPRQSKFKEAYLHIGLISILFVVSGAILWMDLSAPKNITQADTWSIYRQAADYIAENSEIDDPIIIVNNPPAYYAATGKSAIAIPDGDVDTIRAVSRKYHAAILLLDENRIAQLDSLYLSPETAPPDFRWLGSVDGLVVYQLEGIL